MGISVKDNSVRKIQDRAVYPALTSAQLQKLGEVARAKGRQLNQAEIEEALGRERVTVFTTVTDETGDSREFSENTTRIKE